MGKEIFFCFTGVPQTPLQEWFRQGLERELSKGGHHLQEEPTEDTGLVVNFAGRGTPNPVLPSLPSHRTKVVTVIHDEEGPKDALGAGYPLLAYNVCSILILLVGSPQRLETSYFVTLEQGHPEIPYEGDDEEYFARLWYEYLRPRATATWVFDNLFRHDLPESVWQGTPVTQEMIEASRKLDELGLLPTPFPMEGYLTKKQLRFVRLVYKLFGLSYGNVSARASHPDLPPGTFWMSASGVDKTKLKTIGTDIMLVVGREGDSMVVSVPSWVEQPRRVSVDAVEHRMIYLENPSVGAIVHVHGWPERLSEDLLLAYTAFAYPCGSQELADATAEIIRQLPDPSRAVIAQRNHGLVITGPSLPEIFARIEGGLIEISHEIPQR
jgi:ribulose-5-phosphate 4-epimerase/fuculose-1-phosphate aldolase